MSIIILINPVKLIHQEFDFYCDLYDRLEGADDYAKKVIKAQMRASTKRFQAMEDIMWEFGEDIGSASDEIQRKFPIDRLPHEHPRRIKTIIKN
jgi:hypothetical protein